MTFFQQNQLCNIVHNGNAVWFCKFEYMLNDFVEISKLNHEVTFICGNSDYPFTEEYAGRAPQNITRIFATNSMCSDNKRVFSLPIGIESTFPTNRPGHGVGFGFASTKTEQLNIKALPCATKNLIYANFNVNTNQNIRLPLLNNIKNSHHITVSTPTLDIESYFNNIKTHEAVLCPIGNGLDTVRTYETLYCNRIPIIYGSDIIYNQLFKDLPCVYAKTINEILDREFISSEIERAKPKFANIRMAYLEYWIHKISRNI